MTRSTAETTLRSRVEANPLWYHTIELGPGIVTPGWLDLRPIVDQMPWPDVQGRRCLDVGTYDGFLAFELERRGASSVVATDIGDHDRWDWPVGLRERGPQRLAELAGERKGAGFETAREALSSRVERVELSVYDLSPERVGIFDVVVCGSLLLHLKNPIAALEAIHSVCGEAFLSAEQIDLSLSVTRPRRPAARFRGGDQMQWWIPNAAGHRHMLRAAGWRIDRAPRPYSIRLGSGRPRRQTTPRAVARRALQRHLTGGVGLAHSAVLARP